MKPRISVIMAVHNDETYVARSIESILVQQMQAFELILVDDASTDQSSSIIKQFAAKDNRIHVIHNASNIGLTRSLNLGIAAAQGEYIARQDSDDISLRDRLKIQYEFLNDHNDVFLCGTDVQYMSEDGKKLDGDTRILTSAEDIQKTLPKRNCFVHTSIMFRNDGTRYREKFYYSQDYDLYLLLLSQGRALTNLPKKLVKWRMRSSAISSQEREKQLRFAQQAQRFYKQRQENGQDAYETFNPSKILESKNQKTHEEVFYSDQIKYFLQNSESARAKEVYTAHYVQLPKVHFGNKVAFFLFIHFPFVYKLYRKIFYRTPS